MGAFDFDIIQVGYGPVGQSFAALAGREGCRIGVFERHRSIYALPRAAHIDHEVMRILQSLGCADRIEATSLRSNRYEWRNAAGQMLISFEWDGEGISGWPSDYMIFQPDIDAALHEVVAATPSVSVHLGREAVAVRQFDDHVEVTVRDPSDPDASTTVTARYLVAADGGSSFVRQALGLVWDDVGFSQPWLVIDFREKRPISLPFENGQICDPARPMCLFQLGKLHRRFSFMVKPGEGEWAKQPETAWSLVSPWVGPGDVELIRQATYVFESKLLADWRVGRTLFIGDAAHAMPPFMGQGLCSGFRDAANLSWKIALVLSGRAPEALLDSYCLERKPHVADLIRQSVEVGRISCTTDPEAARARDEALLRGERPPPQPPVGLAGGVILLEATSAEATLAGRLGPQNVICLNGRWGRADDLVGPGWHLICAGDPSGVLTGPSRAMLGALEARTIDVDAEGVDVDGAYHRYFRTHGVRAILVRPDFHIYGAAETLERVNTVLEALAGQLRLTAGPSGVRRGAHAPGPLLDAAERRETKMPNVAMTVNDEPVERCVEARRLLVEYLRYDLGLTGVHVGCDTTQCGACTVLIGGEAIKSCTILAVQAAGMEVTTIEGVARAGALHPVQEGFHQCHGLQCGFCTPGMIMSALALLRANPAPTEGEIRRWLDGNICRCTGYQNIVAAIDHAAARLREDAGS